MRVDPSKIRVLLLESLSLGIYLLSLSSHLALCMGLEILGLISIAL